MRIFTSRVFWIFSDLLRVCVGFYKVFTRLSKVPGSNKSIFQKSHFFDVFHLRNLFPELPDGYFDPLVRYKKSKWLFFFDFLFKIQINKKTTFEAQKKCFNIKFYSSNCHFWFFQFLSILNFVRWWNTMGSRSRWLRNS